jgi:hypothetical protein
MGQTLKMMGDSPGAIGAFKKYITMEHRPEEQRWVEKARVELQALEAMQPKSAAPRQKSRIDKEGGSGSGISDEARAQLERELQRDAVLMPTDDDMRLIDPFARTAHLRDLKDPFRGADVDDIVNPFALDPLPRNAATAERLRQYEAALATYRRALSRLAEDVSLRFERGVASALASNASSALKAWHNVPLDDAELRAARESVQRIRMQLLSRR